MGLQRIILHCISAAFLLQFSSAASIIGDTVEKFTTADVDAVAGKSFDYIVVGGGAAGCPLAATLSKSYSVLLVERGGSPYGDPRIEKESSLGFFNLEKGDSDSSAAQSFVSEEGVPNLRGRVLGGTTAINGGFYSRATEGFIERSGWDRELVRDSYSWVESKIVFRPYTLSPLQAVMKEALGEAGIKPYNGFTLEHVEGTKIGGKIFDALGKRHSAADLLMFAGASKLTILLNATVQDVILDKPEDGRKPRALGVRFIKSTQSSNDQVYEAHLSHSAEGTRSWGDVILSAGALGSPQILLLSGIGPPEHLKSFNISSLVPLTEVGQGAQDNPSLVVVLNTSEELQKLSPSGLEVVGVTGGIVVVSSTAPISANATASGIIAKVAKPLSRGELKLNSTDPRKAPRVKYNYLEEEADMEECIKIALLLDKVAKTERIEVFTGRKQDGIAKEGGIDNARLREKCKRDVRSFNHFHGGCLVGSVLDENFRVLGVEGLRVVDGSTFFDSPGTNPMATLMMLGRYQGIKILRERHVK